VAAVDTSIVAVLPALSSVAPRSVPALRRYNAAYHHAEKPPPMRD